MSKQMKTIRTIAASLLLPLLAGCNGNAVNNTSSAEADEETTTRISPEFSSDSAFHYVAQQCSFGPRTMNSEAHEQCAQYLVNKFRQFGANVDVQEGPGKLSDGTPITIKNIRAVYNDSCQGRVIISSHWDSRPWADNDADEANHKTPIDGANDGASGVGILLEIARQIQIKNPGIGIELICWDAEDSGTSGSESSWCLGSQYWAANHTQSGFRYLFGILLDMVGGRNSEFRLEEHSKNNAPSVLTKIWTTGQNLGYGKYFKSMDIGGVIDDHLQMMNSGIPSVDIIGCDPSGSTFPSTWHTIDDNISNIDKDVLKAVGQTVLEIVYTL